MSIRVYTGQTFRATVSNLTDAAGDALTTPTVEITLYFPDGTDEAGNVTNSGTTYYAEFTSTDVGDHGSAAVATAGGGTWKDIIPVYVASFV